jgi:hypothetical protein
MKLKNTINALVISAVLASGSVHAMDDDFQGQNRRNRCQNCPSDGDMVACFLGTAVLGGIGLFFYTMVTDFKLLKEQVRHCPSEWASSEHKICIDAQGANPYYPSIRHGNYDHWQNHVANKCIKAIALRKEKDGILDNPEMTCVKALEAGLFSENPIDSRNLKPYSFGNTADMVAQDVIDPRDLDEAVNKAIANFLQ